MGGGLSLKEDIAVFIDYPLFCEAPCKRFDLSCDLCNTYIMSVAYFIYFFTLYFDMLELHCLLRCSLIEFHYKQTQRFSNCVPMGVREKAKFSNGG